MLWGDWGWCWGEPGGEAHMVAEGLKMILNTEEERTKFLHAVETDAEFDAVKVVLALKIERACLWRAQDYELDEAGRAAWKAILDDMIETRFEGENGDQELVGRIAKCTTLTKDETPLTSPRASVASALKTLHFVEMGLA